MLKLYLEVEMHLLFCPFEMEKWGILVKKEALKEYGDLLERQIKELEQVIYKEAGEEFNINSPKQLGEVLFDKLCLPYGKRQKPAGVPMPTCWKSSRAFIRSSEKCWNTAC